MYVLVLYRCTELDKLDTLAERLHATLILRATPHLGLKLAWS